MMRRGSRQYAVELDGATYGFTDGSLEPIDDIKALDGDKWFVTDLQEAISRTVTIESPGKYAELLVRKQLQESGEFEEPVSVIVHWQKKRGKNTTDIFFTAIPSRLHRYYFESIREYDDNVLLFPLYAVLLGVLKHMRPKEPVAIVFQHNRFAELIIGDRKRIYYANRCLAFDTSEEQIQNLWETVRLDIKAVEDENRIKVLKVFSLNWIDSGLEPEWPDDVESEFYSFEEEDIAFQGVIRQVSFFDALNIQSGLQSASSFLEKTFYFTQRWAFRLNAIFFLIVLLLAGGYLWSDLKAASLQKDMRVLEREIEKIKLKTAAMDISQAEYRNTMGFVKDLAYYKSAPPYKQIINDLSEALFAEVKLEVLKMDYSENEVKLELFGRITAPFDKAHQGYKRFLKILKRKEYIVKESRFETEIKESQLLIKLKKRIQ
jgi:hypothetical protein